MLNSIFQVVNEYGWTLLDLVFPNKAMAEVARTQYAIQEGVSEDSIEIVEVVVARPTQLVMYDEIIAHGLLRD